MFPPVIGDIPNISVEEGKFDNRNLGQYLTSMHSSDSPRWRKQASFGLINPWQNADWFTVDEQGNMNIAPPDRTVNKDETQTLTVEAYNNDGEDSQDFMLTVIYVPDPPEWEDIPIIEVNEDSVINFRLDQYWGNNPVNVLRIDSVAIVTAGAPPLFLKASVGDNVGQILGSNNASDSGAVGTGGLQAAGQDPDVNTINTPDVAGDTDYTVTVTAINTNLITTPEYPENSGSDFLYI